MNIFCYCCNFHKIVKHLRRGVSFSVNSIIFIFSEAMSSDSISKIIFLKVDSTWMIVWYGKCLSLEQGYWDLWLVVILPIFKLYLKKRSMMTWLILADFFGLDFHICLLFIIKNEYPFQLYSVQMVWWKVTAFSIQ